MKTLQSVCFGREPELQLLDLFLDGAVEKGQQFVLFEGEPGVGKSALLDAFGSRTTLRPRRRRPRVLRLAPPERDAYRPVRHAALAATSRRLYQKLGDERQVREMARDILPGWIGAIPIWGNLIAAIIATADALHRWRRRKRFAALDTTDEYVEALLSAAHRRPLVLLLDDLHQADEEACAQLESLLRTADEGARILVVGAFRPTPPGVADPPIFAMIRRLPMAGEGYLHRYLEPLEHTGTEELLRHRLSVDHLPGGLLPFLLEITGGHPAELLRAVDRLQQGGALTRTSSAGWLFEEPGERLDAGMQAVHTAADLGNLGPAIRSTVLAASRLAEQFTALAVARATRLDELLVEDQLALGERYGVLLRTGDVEEDGEITTVYRFRSAHLRSKLRSEPVQDRPNQAPDAPVPLPEPDA